MRNRPKRSAGSAAASRLERRAAAKRDLETLIASKTRSVLVFTDGACKSNPGPAGSGVCVIVPPHLHEQTKDADGDGDASAQPGDTSVSDVRQTVVASASMTGGSAAATSLHICAWQNLGHATNQRAELNAMRMFFDLFRCPERVSETYGVRWNDVESVELFSDSRYSVQLANGSWKAAKNVELVEEVQRGLNQFRVAYPRTPIFVRWVVAHADVRGNELADALANKGVKDAQAAETRVVAINLQRST
jgi:ribonuclease HI